MPKIKLFIAENEAILLLFEEEKEELRKEKDFEIETLKELFRKSSKHCETTIHVRKST